MTSSSGWGRLGRVIPAVAAMALSSAVASAQFWPQWALNPQHTGQVGVAGQPLNRELADVVYDPLVPAEMAANQGQLQAHYQVPLLEDSTTLFMEFKSGTYNKNRYDTQVWGENGLQWINGQLVPIWSFTSDWKAPGSQADFFEPVFHGVLANGYVYVPGAGGTIFKLKKSDGSVVSRINPFTGIDPTIFVASVLSADGSGNIYYNVIQQFNPGTGLSFFQHDIVDSWLVKVSPQDATTRVSYSVLTSVTAALSQPAPKPGDSCLGVFSLKDLPFPPSPDAVPPSVPCGRMRPGLNAAPAIAPDGTIYTVTRNFADLTGRYSGMAAVNSDLTPKWWTSFRDRLNDACNNDTGTFPGALLPANGTPGGCRLGTTPGVDPAQNTKPGARVVDDTTSSPTIGPDGSVFYGAYTRYDFERGHLLKFDSNGQFLAAYSFGWDSTPAIYTHDGTYSLIIKDNEYGGGPGFGSYCNVDAFCPPRQSGPFFITRLDSNLHVEWKFQNTNNQACTRNPDGTVTCVPHNSGTQWPNVGFEWCINAPVVDANGVVYVNSEDGNLYAINPGGGLKQSIFLQLALGAPYTPLAIAPDGKIYTQQAGQLIVVGQ
jgi:outer membrane protein assembly factor BamB